MATLDLDVCAPLDHALAIKIVEALQDANPRFAMRPDRPVVTPDNHNLRLVKHLYLLSDLVRLDVLSEVEGVGLCRLLSAVGINDAYTEPRLSGAQHRRIDRRENESGSREGYRRRPPSRSSQAKQQQPELFRDPPA